METPLALTAHAVRRDLRGLSTEFITTVAGVAAAVAMISLNVLLERSLDLDLLGLTYAFILPVGGILGGWGAATGYYVAARITHTLPNRRMLFEMLAIGASTWLLMHWVEYSTLRLANGHLVSESWPFLDYLRLRAEHLHLSISTAAGPARDTTPELGILGYVHELIQLAGFLAGGFGMWAALTVHETCAPCSRYAGTRALLPRATTAIFDELLRRAGVQLPGFPQRVAEKVGAKRLVGMTLHLATCPSCRRSWLRPGVVVLESNHPVVRRLDPCDVDAAQAAALQLAAPAK